MRSIDYDKLHDKMIKIREHDINPADLLMEEKNDHGL